MRRRMVHDLHADRTAWHALRRRTGQPRLRRHSQRQDGNGGEDDTSSQAAMFRGPRHRRSKRSGHHYPSAPVSTKVRGSDALNSVLVDLEGTEEVLSGRVVRICRGENRGDLIKLIADGYELGCRAQGRAQAVCAADLDPLLPLRELQRLFVRRFALVVIKRA
jgi:hypothetical protein